MFCFRGYLSSDHLKTLMVVNIFRLVSICVFQRSEHIEYAPGAALYWTPGACATPKEKRRSFKD